MNPIPRVNPDSPAPISWSVKRTLQLKSPARTPTLPFADVFENRRSVRRLVPAPIGEIAAAVSFATRSRFQRNSVSAANFRRPCASAGALHPFSVAISTGVGARRAFLCEPDSHRLLELTLCAPTQLDELHARRRTMLDEANGWCFWGMRL